MNNQNTKTDQQNSAKLAIKVLKVSNALKIKKDGFNEHSKYKFISDEAIMEAMPRVLLDNNLLVRVNNCEVVNQTEFVTTNSYGKEQVGIRTHVIISVLLIDAETGYSEMIPNFPGIDQDYGGKSCQQAITQAYKYALKKIFFIADRNDSDQQTVTQNEKTTKVSIKYSEVTDKNAMHPVHGKNPSNGLTNKYDMNVEAGDFIIAKIPFDLRELGPELDGVYDKENKVWYLLPTTYNIETIKLNKIKAWNKDKKQI